MRRTVLGDAAIPRSLRTSGPVFDEYPGVPNDLCRPKGEDDGPCRALCRDIVIQAQQIFLSRDG